MAELSHVRSTIKEPKLSKVVTRRNPSKNSTVYCLSVMMARVRQRRRFQLEEKARGHIVSVASFENENQLRNKKRGS